jgi:cation diffusion facilitator CzcD-associated flavoprotein CzcO
VDTDGKGPSSPTTTGLVFDGKDFPFDVLILSTGYRTPAIGNGSPAARTGIEIYGRKGRSLEDKWQTEGASTLHGLSTNGFPNLFFVGPTQAASAANFVLTLDTGAEHMAYVISEANRKNKRVLEISVEARKNGLWSVESEQHGLALLLDALRATSTPRERL